MLNSSHFACIGPPGSLVGSTALAAGISSIQLDDRRPKPGARVLSPSDRRDAVRLAHEEALSSTAVRELPIHSILAFRRRERSMLGCVGRQLMQRKTLLLAEFRIEAKPSSRGCERAGTRQQEDECSLGEVERSGQTRNLPTRTRSERRATIAKRPRAGSSAGLTARLGRNQAGPFKKSGPASRGEAGPGATSTSTLRQISCSPTHEHTRRTLLPRCGKCLSGKPILGKLARNVTL